MTSTCIHAFQRHSPLFLLQIKGTQAGTGLLILPRPEFFGRRGLIPADSAEFAELYDFRLHYIFFVIRSPA
jgi:hypothetical protein